MGEARVLKPVVVQVVVRMEILFLAHCVRSQYNPLTYEQE